MSAGSSSITPTGRWHTLVAPLCLSLAALWLVLWFAHAGASWAEDAWLHLEFARSLAAGRGFAVNGSVFYAESSPLWAALLALVHLVLPGWLPAGKVLAVAAAVFALTGFFRLAVAFSADGGREYSRRFAPGALLVLVVSPALSLWAFSGMESLAAAGLLCWTLVLLPGASWQNPTASRSFLLTCAGAGLAPLLRPELALLTFLLGLVLFTRWANLPVPARRKVTLFFLALLLILGPGVVWLIYAARTFGALLPNALDAGVASPRTSVLGLLLGNCLLTFPLAILGLPLLLPASWRGHLAPKRYGQPSTAHFALSTEARLLLCLTALLWLGYLLHHTHVSGRDLLLVAPALTLLILAAAHRSSPRLYLGLIALGVAFGIVVSFLTAWPMLRNQAQRRRDLTDLARFVQALPPDAPVALGPVGQVAFLSGHPVVDLSGNLQPGIIPLLWDVPDNRRVWWVHEQGARYMLLNHPPEPGSLLVWRRATLTAGKDFDPRGYSRQDLLLLWKLPPAPTLPLAPELQTPNEP